MRPAHVAGTPPGHATAAARPPPHGTQTHTSAKQPQAQSTEKNGHVGGLEEKMRTVCFHFRRSDPGVAMQGTSVQLFDAARWEGSSRLPPLGHGPRGPRPCATPRPPGTRKGPCAGGHPGRPLAGLRALAAHARHFWRPRPRVTRAGARPAPAARRHPACHHWQVFEHAASDSAPDPKAPRRSARCVPAAASGRSLPRAQRAPRTPVVA